MKSILALILSAFACIAQAADNVQIQVEETPVQIGRDVMPRWVETPIRSDEEASSVITAAEKAGGICHEISTKEMVACFFHGANTVGFNWDKLANQAEPNTVVVPGTKQAAELMARSYSSAKFIVIDPATEIEDGKLQIKALVGDQECTLFLSQTQPGVRSESGWMVYGQVCGEQAKNAQLSKQS
jgi:hypothetical protein